MAYAQSQLTKLHRSVKRGSYDKELVAKILDAGVVAHVVLGQNMARFGGEIFRRLPQMEKDGISRSFSTESLTSSPRFENQAISTSRSFARAVGIRF